MQEEFILKLDPSFPFHNVTAIGDELQNSNLLIPGFLPPQAGLMSIGAAYYAECVDRQQTTVIADLNLILAIVQVARDGVRRPHTDLAVNLMAYCQALNWQIEPGLAFRELAFNRGNKYANEELAWFRTADEARANDWIELALGNRDKHNQLQPKLIESHNLAAQIHRWDQNYGVALKIAELELSSTTNFSKIIELLDWMDREFIFAGPAALFATLYFSKSRPKGMIKQIQSVDRQKSIDGIKNAAWDITYLSHFIEKIQFSAGFDRFIFATADKALAEVATKIVGAAESLSEFEVEIEQSISQWWSQDDAKIIASKLRKGIVNAMSRRKQVLDLKEILGSIELKIRTYCPSPTK